MNFLTKIKYYWVITFIFAAIILSFSHFKSESNDSKYYTQLVVRYQHESWTSIITPKWGENYWGFTPKSYMTDQFPGQLVMGVTLTRMGLPAEQALHILGLFFQVSSFFVIYFILCEFLEPDIASIALYGLMLIPLSFSYNIRANHELGIMFFSLLALLSGLRIQTNRAFLLITILSTLFLLFIKGPFFIFGLALFAVGFTTSRSPNNVKKNWPLAFFVLILTAVITVVAAIVFDRLFKQITDLSFLESFYRIQITNRALNAEHNHSFIIQKLVNFYYYFSHFVAYSLPWSALFSFFLFSKNFRHQLRDQIKSKISICLLLASFSFIAFFMMSDRTAGRYVFPGYYLFSTWILVLLIQSSSAIKALHLKLVHRSKFPIMIVSFWLMTICLHFIF